MNKLVSILLILLIGFGSFGVKIFEHACSMDGITISYFIPKRHSCKSVVTTPACCAKSKVNLDIPTTYLEKKDCCSDAVNVYQWMPNCMSDMDASFLTLTPFTFTSCLEVDFFCKAPFTCKVVKIYPPPIAYVGRDILIKKRVLQI